MANNSLLIGKLIYQTLSNDAGITQYVGDNIWPVVAPYEVQNPYIVFLRTNDYSTAYSKDGYVGDTVSFQINVFSDKYIDSVEIANLVRNSFEGHIISNNELEISSIRMTNATEQFVEDTYIQALTFDCQTNIVNS